MTLEQTKLNDSDLIDHILTRYHERHRQQLSELIDAAEKVERVHADHAECPKGLAGFLSGVASDLYQHMMKEESILFPMIKAGQGAMAVGPISVMRHEHELHGTAIEALKKFVNGLKLPNGACSTWRFLYEGIDVFIADLTQHIELENEVLFARQA